MIHLISAAYEVCFLILLADKMQKWELREVIKFDLITQVTSSQ